MPGFNSQHLVDWTSRLNRISAKEREAFVRTLDFYNRSLLEVDEVNQFIFLWTMLEAWKVYKNGSSIGGRHKKYMLEILEEYGYLGTCKDRENVYDIRADVFHEGVSSQVSSILPEIKKCAAKIALEVRNTTGI